MKNALYAVDGPFDRVSIADIPDIVAHTVVT
jgi:hypothetical protein